MKKFFHQIKLLIISFLAAPSVLEINATTCPTGHKGYKADAALTTRHMLVKAGSDDNHVAIIAAASDEPLGIAQDEPEAAEDAVNIAVLGAFPGTVLVVAGETVTANEDAYSKGDGKVMDEPAVAGTYWKIGRFITGGSSGDEVEMQPCAPVKVVVIALLGNTNSEISAIALAAETSTNGTAAAASADLAALAAETEKIGDDVRDVRAKYTSVLAKLEELADDVRAIAAALETPALIKALTA